MIRIWAANPVPSVAAALQPLHPLCSPVTFLTRSSFGLTMVPVLCMLLATAASGMLTFVVDLR